MIYTFNAHESGEACEDLQCNRCTPTLTPRRTKTNSNAERAVRGVDVGTSAIPLQSGLEIPWNDTVICADVQDLLQTEDA